jgi:hypothetical protein
MIQWDQKINISLQVTAGYSALIIIAYRQTLDRASFQHDHVALFCVHIKDKWFKQLRSTVWLVSWPLTALILLRLLIDQRARVCVCVCVCGGSCITETFFNCTLAVVRVIKDNGCRKLAKTCHLREALFYPLCRARSWTSVSDGEPLVLETM